MSGIQNTDALSQHALPAIIFISKGFKIFFPTFPFDTPENMSFLWVFKLKIADVKDGANNIILKERV